jgi:small conductance mechanosensitive channel
MGYNILQIKTDSLTQKLTGKAYDWIVIFGPKLLIAIVVFIIGQWIIRLINRGLKRILSIKRFDATLRPFIQNLLHIAMQVLLVLGLMQILGIQMTLFAAVIGAFGVAIGLSLSGTLQNFAGGILIILLKPFRVGEDIKAQGEEGTVVAIKLFYTVIRSYTNTLIIVPNGKLSNEIIFNFSREKKRRMDLGLSLTYDVDYNKVRSVIQKAIDNSEDCLKDPPSRISIETLGAATYTVLINVWFNTEGFVSTKSKFTEELMNGLKPHLTKSIEQTMTRLKEQFKN